MVSWQGCQGIAGRQGLARRAGSWLVGMVWLAKKASGLLADSGWLAGGLTAGWLAGGGWLAGLSGWLAAWLRLHAWLAWALDF